MRISHIGTLRELLVPNWPYYFHRARPVSSVLAEPTDSLRSQDRWTGNWRST